MITVDLIKPTRLYIKQHSKTGLKYFGKTIKHDVIKYKGSGKRWKRHIKKHGVDNVITCWISKEYTSKEEIQKDALYMSEKLDIVNSKEWANLVPENGIGGNQTCPSEEAKQRMRKPRNSSNMHPNNKGDKNPMFGRNHTSETKVKMSIAAKNREPMTEDHKLKISIARKEMKYTEEAKVKMSFAQLGVPKTKISCIYCKETIGGLSNFNRWHGSHCKLKEHK